jgi:hypothetical protein
MARRVFYSFHYDADCWRTSQVRNIGAIDGSKVASDNDWEQVKRGGDQAIQRWIDTQLNGRSCTVVLIGAGTAGRKWINYEILKSWNEKKGLLGVHVHGLKDSKGQPSAKGANPVVGFRLQSGEDLSTIIPVADPAFATSQDVYNSIAMNLALWIEQAIQVRSNYP